jgi:ribosomal protein S18 acetylase RimI-like enzyme
LLLAEVETIARERGCGKLTLEVLEGNEPAKRAYRNFGFDAYQLDPALGQALFWQKTVPPAA